MWATIAGLAGLALTAWIVVHEGVQDIFHLLATAGWGLLWLVPLHLVPIAADARGWQALLRPFDASHHATLPFLTWIATVREAVDRLLPVANVGGQFVGIRLALLRPITGAAAAASVLVEVLLTVVNQYLFTALGLVLLVMLVHDTPVTHGLVFGLVATLPVPVLLFFLLRNGRVFGRIKGWATRLLGNDHHLLARLAESAAQMDHDLRALLHLPRPLAGALAWQLGGMILGGAETWLMLWLLGHPVSIWEALALESLSMAVRNFAFFVPAGLGVQEASLVVFGTLIGLPADVSVALSLAKRLRDIGFGIPALLSWQWVEVRHLRNQRSHGSAPDC
ncbi:MAG: hypothetical protein EPN72_11535 [Nevskiaceae bacterium]|nr:MAG: hypothetical protein EPN63_01445 [Nevskiaceae bacterium]TBR72082.1 MAG: hypothetical protein EPN72_11535 [Nevskiaceae bacterium]